MSRLGPNVKLTLDPKHRDLTRRMFTEVFGAMVIQPTPTMQVYRLEDTQIGANYVAEGLSEAQHALGPWLEILVGDLDQAHAQLLALGLEQQDYVDQSHAYFAAPGGWIFRLARL
jgi:hypothetical protein